MHRAMHRARALSVSLLLCVTPAVFARQSAPADSAPPAPAAAALPALPAQAAPQTPAGEAIQIDVAVTDKSGDPVPGLELSDFTLFDEGHPVPIASVRAHAQETQPETGWPVQVILVIDTMNTDFNGVAYVRAQVQSFLRQNGGHLPYPVSVDWITEKGVKAQDTPTLDGNALADELTGMESRMRSFNLAQGVYGDVDRFRLSMQFLRAIAISEAVKPGKKLIVWTGPGWPMLGGPNYQLSPKDHRGALAEIIDMSALLRQARISLCSVSQGQAVYGFYYYQNFLKGVRYPEDASLANLGVQVLAVQTGGLVETPTNNLVQSIDACIRGAGTFYTLAFTPPPAGGPNDYHKLDLRVGKPGLTVRTTTGYYGQPVQR